MAEEPEYITGLEPEAEDMIRAFPKNPVVCAGVHSIAISLRRIADAVCGDAQNTGIHKAILDISDNFNITR